MIEVGGYDTRYGRSYEDVDLSRRLIARGYRLAYEPVAVARHPRTDTLRSLMASCWSYDHWPEYDAGSYHSAPRMVTKLARNMVRAARLSHKNADNRDYGALRSKAGLPPVLIGRVRADRPPRPIGQLRGRPLQERLSVEDADADSDAVDCVVEVPRRVLIISASSAGVPSHPAPLRGKAHSMRKQSGAIADLSSEVGLRPAVFSRQVGRRVRSSQTCAILEA